MWGKTGNLSYWTEPPGLVEVQVENTFDLKCMGKSICEIFLKNNLWRLPPQVNNL
jgi:hypothetical protein